MSTNSEAELPDELEDAIKRLTLVSSTAEFDERMAKLFAESSVAEVVQRPQPIWRRRLASLLTISASLLIGFGAGTWFGTSQIWPQKPENAVAFGDENASKDRSKVIAQSLERQPAGENQTIDLPRTRTVARNTSLSAPLWLASKDGRVFRSYIANTREEIIEIDPATQKKKIVERFTPRIVISNSPGI